MVRIPVYICIHIYIYIYIYIYSGLRCAPWGCVTEQYIVTGGETRENKEYSPFPPLLRGTMVRIPVYITIYSGLRCAPWGCVCCLRASTLPRDLPRRAQVFAQVVSHKVSRRATHTQHPVTRETLRDLFFEMRHVRKHPQGPYPSLPCLRIEAAESVRKTKPTQ